MESKKKDAYYFSHDSNSLSDPMILCMVEDFGFESYGLFWVVLEFMRDSSSTNYKLEYNPQLCKAIKRRTQTKINVAEYLEKCINEYHLFYIDENMLCSKSFLNRMNNYEDIIAKRREAGKQSAQKRNQTTNTDATNVQQVFNKCSTEPEQNSTTKLNETKLNKTKLNEINNKKEDNIVEKDFLPIFDEVRKFYPGTKLGNEKEFSNFTKKNKNWIDILPKLKPAIKYQIAHNEKLASQGKFIPEWKNFQTWINQRCWEQEYGETNYAIKPDPNKVILVENTWMGPKFI